MPYTLPRPAFNLSSDMEKSIFAAWSYVALKKKNALVSLGKLPLDAGPDIDGGMTAISRKMKDR